MLGRTLLGPTDSRLPAFLFILCGFAWLALEGRAYPRFERFVTGDYAKIELYTRLAADGSQRLGAESHFHVHHLGPAFFYGAAPVYLAFGATTRGMAAAALVWNLVFLIALVRGASRLAPGHGAFVSALLLFAFLHARGQGWLLSSWNPYVSILPFGVALVAFARLATGESWALPIAALCGSVALQGHMVWAPPLAFGAACGLLLGLWPAARARLGVPTRGERVTARAMLASVIVLCVLWALPVYDELTGSYQNLHRIVTMARDPYEPRPWHDALGPMLRALDFGRGLEPEASPAAGASDAAAVLVGGARPREVLRAGLLAAALAIAGGLAARRGAATAALALVAALASLGLPVVARQSPGRELPWYLLQWGAMITLTALVVVGVEVLARSARLGRLASGRAGALLLALAALVPPASSIATQRAAGASERDPRSVLVERLTAEVKARARRDIGLHRFLLRVAPHEDQALVVGLILALDKAKVPFSVEPFGSCRIEGRFTPRGNEWAELLIGNLEALPGAERIGPAEGLSVVWQLKPF